jgi:hypothetical protein
MGDYYNYIKQQGVAPTVISGESNARRVDSAINFSWGTGSPMPGISSDAFMVVWSGALKPALTGTYNLYISADDGVRVYLGEVLLVDSWDIENLRTIAVSGVTLDSFISYNLRIEYFEQDGAASVVFQWESPSLGISLTTVPSSVLFHSEPCNCTNTGFTGGICDQSIFHHFFSFLSI